MEMIEKVRKVLIILLCASIIVAIVSGQNRKKAYGDGYQKEEQQDKLVFSGSVSKKELQLEGLERIGFESQIMDWDDVIEAVTNMSGVEYEETNLEKDKEGLYYNDEENGIVINYSDRVQDKYWTYINSSVQEDVTAITENEAEIRLKLYNKLTGYGYEVEETPTVKEDKAEMSSERSYIYRFLENGIPVEGGAYSIGEKEVVMNDLGCNVIYKNKGISQISIYGYKTTKREPFAVKNIVWKQAKQALRKQIRAKDTIEDWKQYSVEDAETVYLPAYSHGLGTVKREFVPAIKFRCLVTSYNYRTDKCSTTKEYFIYNMEQDQIAYSYDIS